MLEGTRGRKGNSPDSDRHLASARLRRRLIVLLYQALEDSGLTQSDLARKLGFRKSAVNQVFRGDGNIRTTTLAHYLHAMGYELDVHLVPAGEPRRAAQEGRAAHRAILSSDWTTSASAALIDAVINLRTVRLWPLAASTGAANPLHDIRSMRIDFFDPVTSQEGIKAVRRGLTATSALTSAAYITGTADEL